MIKKLKPIEVLALSKAVNGELKPAREKVHAGQYPVNFTVKIAGTLKVGNDYTQEVSRVDPWAILMVIAQDVSMTGGNGDSMLHNAAAIVSQLDLKGDGIVRENIDDVKKIVKGYFDVNKKCCKGKVESHLFSERSL